MGLEPWPPAPQAWILTTTRQMFALCVKCLVFTLSQMTASVQFRQASKLARQLKNIDFSDLFNVSRSHQNVHGVDVRLVDGAKFPCDNWCVKRSVPQAS